MTSYSDANFLLNNSLDSRQQQERLQSEAATSPPRIIPGRRRSRSNGFFTTNPLRIFTTSSSQLSSSVTPPSTSQPQVARGLPASPIDSESFPEPLSSTPEESANEMYKLPGQNVYIVPYGSAPIGSHPGWPGLNAAAATHQQPAHQSLPKSNYYPGQPRTYYEDARTQQRFVVPNSGYETDSYEDGAPDPRAYASDTDRRRSRRYSRSSGLYTPAAPPPAPSASFSMQYSQYENRAAYRPPKSVSPANSSATDESGRSSAASYTSNHGVGNAIPQGRSVRWRESLVAPTPPPSAPRPKGWFNRRGDQLWCNDGRYKAAVEEYPHYLRDYPDVGEGWMNEHGVRISMTHRRVPELCARPPKGVLKNAGNPLAI